MIKRPQFLQAGFTMIELVISMTIISLALLGTLLAINTAGVYSGDPMLDHQGISIAESYLEEILQKGFSTVASCPAPPSPGGRASFNDVCQYNGLSQPPTSQAGVAISSLLNTYTVTVTVDSSAASLGTLTPGTQVERVDVTVSHSTMPTMTFSSYRTNY